MTESGGVLLAELPGVAPGERASPIEEGEPPDGLGELGDLGELAIYLPFHSVNQKFSLEKTSPQGTAYGCGGWCGDLRSAMGLGRTGARSVVSVRDRKARPT